MVYLIHFSKPFHHARHYLGYTEDLKKRLHHHKKGTGSRLLRAVGEAGINFRVVRTWPDADGHFEQKLKKGKNSSKLCPICKKKHAKNVRVTEREQLIMSDLSVNAQGQLIEETIFEGSYFCLIINCIRNDYFGEINFDYNPKSVSDKLNW